MGWAYCGTNRHGQEIGYGVIASCDWPGCETQIDRGLDYLCGEMHDDGESCNKYFCETHRVCVYPKSLCRTCAANHRSDTDESDVDEQA